MDQFSTYVVVHRLAERSIISAVVVLLAIVVTIGFWRSLQNIDFSLSRGPIGGGGTLALATPVLAMLALIGFAWVTFSNPVAYGLTAAVPEAPAAVASTARVDFRGSTPNPAVRDLGVRRSQILVHVRDLNCLMEGLPLSPSEENAFAEAKLALMREVWDPAWGDPDAFAEWLIFRGSVNAAAQAVYEETREPCRDQGN